MSRDKSNYTKQVDQVKVCNNEQETNEWLMDMPKDSIVKDIKLSSLNGLDLILIHYKQIIIV
ncbi:hypothetical protein [Aquibacillus saliphilus]|uniref:hypothetical protein n=1 Tax=Aquibacillus saliphilus TaxID=1909422 RepID=UPI001CF00BA3|nr:hypothetical protein [Aquibacillus saliphilus]